MKKLSLCHCCTLLAFLFMLLITSCKGTKTVAHANADMPGYQLVWSDEFNGTAVDTTNWNFEINGNGGGKHEQENYQGGQATGGKGQPGIYRRKKGVRAKP